MDKYEQRAEKHRSATEELFNSYLTHWVVERGPMTKGHAVPLLCKTCGKAHAKTFTMTQARQRWMMDKPIAPCACIARAATWAEMERLLSPIWSIKSAAAKSDGSNFIECINGHTRRCNLHTIRREAKDEADGLMYCNKCIRDKGDRRSLEDQCFYTVSNDEKHPEENGR